MFPATSLQSPLLVQRHSFLPPLHFTSLVPDLSLFLHLLVVAPFLNGDVATTIGVFPSVRFLSFEAMKSSLATRRWSMTFNARRGRACFLRIKLNIGEGPPSSYAQHFSIPPLSVVRFLLQRQVEKTTLCLARAWPRHPR